MSRDSMLSRRGFLLGLAGLGAGALVDAQHEREIAAPWHQVDVDEGITMQQVPGCLSCDILAGRITPPGGVIYENEHWHVDSVVSPVFWRGFLIVKLKRHCEHLADLTPAEAAALGPVVQTTCQAVSEVLKPAKVYVCSFGDAVKHIHFWVLPRPPEMHPSRYWVFWNLSVRAWLTQLGVKAWVYSDEEVAEMADQVRQRFRWLLSQEA